MSLSLPADTVSTLGNPPFLTDRTEKSPCTGHVPRHIAIIPDGNRRWANQQNRHISAGHKEGAGNIIDIVQTASELGVKHVTFYLFSTENWSRPQGEVAALMLLLECFLIEQLSPMLEKGVRFHTIGDLTPFPDTTRSIIEETKRATRECCKIDLIAALNYGARNEIKRALIRLVKDVQQQKVDEENIDEAMIGKYLDTSCWPDPDLLIRTSGEQRVSNFLLWQISYAEIYITSVLWPDFAPEHLMQAIEYYKTRIRRMGGGA